MHYLQYIINFLVILGIFANTNSDLKIIYMNILDRKIDFKNSPKKSIFLSDYTKI